MTDVLSENKAYFNKIAGQYDQRNADAVVQLERGLQQKVPFIGINQGARLLDYACGTGMLSRALAEYTSESIGIDLSEDMVGVYNAQAQSQVSFVSLGSMAYSFERIQGSDTLKGSSRKAYQGNLADPSDASPASLSEDRFFNFDVAGVGLGFHHFDKPELASKRLAGRLKAGGVLFIIDFVAHEMSAEQAAGRGITHHGFTEEETKAMFENAGLEGFGYEEFPEPITFNDPHGRSHGHGHDHGHGADHSHGYGNSDNKGSGMSRRIFIARASKL
ncbi:2-heptaprenyl- -naphthoquinone [Fusarium albosuccineum]|uniref:2-heptaprenyl- -naphthoquinone n=1 Tax=Fusarium albosuccineum TaxID=1237068 RepID=A0A8H4P3D7_9HYPO|nr:2-heptaprenyl- -naphthoquinone [Fusarium albosuccineum]